MIDFSHDVDLILGKYVFAPKCVPIFFHRARGFLLFGVTPPQQRLTKAAQSESTEVCCPNSPPSTPWRSGRFSDAMECDDKNLPITVQITGKTQVWHILLSKNEF